MNSKGMCDVCKSPNCAFLIYFWIPPTDEERVMFANSSRHLIDCTKCDGFCDWYMRRSGLYGQCVSEEIARSLALDGMDIDQLSEIEKLMK